MPKKPIYIEPPLMRKTWLEMAQYVESLRRLSAKTGRPIVILTNEYSEDEYSERVLGHSEKEE